MLNNPLNQAYNKLTEAYVRSYVKSKRSRKNRSPQRNSRPFTPAVSVAMIWVERKPVTG